MKRLLKKLMSLFQEFGDKCHFFNPFDALVFTLSPYTRIGMERKHEVILNKLEKGFMNQYTKVKSMPEAKCQDIGGDAPLWVCWLQGREQMPRLVDICVRSIERNAGVHPVNFISLGNLSKFVDIPSFVIQKLNQGIISYTHFSDIIRMALLIKYSGIWIDATIFVTSEIGEYNLPFYSIKQRTENKRFVERGDKWTAYFIASGKNNPVVNTIYRFFIYYWSEYNSMIDYFLVDYALALAYRNIPEFKEWIEWIPFDNEHVYEMFQNLNAPYSKDLEMKLFQQQFNKLSWKRKLNNGDTIGQSLLKINS